MIVLMLLLLLLVAITSIGGFVVRYIIISKIESLLDKELANVQKNEDVCSDILGNQKSKILEYSILSTKY